MGKKKKTETAMVAELEIENEIPEGSVSFDFDFGDLDKEVVKEEKQESKALDVKPTRYAKFGSN